MLDLTQGGAVPAEDKKRLKVQKKIREKAIGPAQRNRTKEGQIGKYCEGKTHW